MICLERVRGGGDGGFKLWLLMVWVGCGRICFELNVIFELNVVFYSCLIRFD